MIIHRDKISGGFGRGAGLLACGFGRRLAASAARAYDATYNAAETRADRSRRNRRHEQGRAAIVSLALGCFLVGIGAGIFLLARAHKTPERKTGETALPLSEPTLTVLRGLKAPVEIRYYSLLDPASTSPALRNYATRVDQVLTQYQQAAAGRIMVTRQTERSDAAANTAAAAGIRPFNLDRGDACFLGIAVIQQDRKELLPQLSPDWEAAFESDLTRAIVRASTAQPPARRIATPTLPASDVVQAVKQIIPEPASVSFEEGKRLLQSASHKEFQSAAKTLQAQVKSAEAQFLQAQNGGSEAEQQAARQELLRMQQEQTRRLKELAAQRQALMAAWEQLKGAPPSGPVPKR